MRPLTPSLPPPYSREKMAEVARRRGSGRSIKRAEHLRVRRMPFDPAKHHRRSIRLKGYDYSKPGGYFVTVVTQEREPFFGIIRNDEMVLNTAGEMVRRWWQGIPNKYPSVDLGSSVVMPNHIHGILLIRDTDTVSVGADLRVCPDEGEHAGSPLPNKQNPSLSQIVQWFKTMTTNEYIRGVKGLEWEPFQGKLWQRNYYACPEPAEGNISSGITQIGIASTVTLKPTLPIGRRMMNITPTIHRNMRML